jgi:hypothetical protein
VYTQPDTYVYYNYEFERIGRSYYRVVYTQPDTYVYYNYEFEKRRYLVECTRLISVITSTDTFKFIIIINVCIWLSVHDSVITSTDHNQTIGKSNNSKLSRNKKAKGFCLFVLSDLLFFKITNPN